MLAGARASDCCCCYVVESEKVFGIESEVVVELATNTNVEGFKTALTLDRCESFLNERGNIIGPVQDYGDGEPTCLCQI